MTDEVGFGVGDWIFIADLTGSRPNVMIEVGYALKHIDTGRMLFYFQPSGCSDKPPFDINNFRYEEINDSKDIESKIKPHIEAILKNALTGDA